jgi:hypothetical protein
MVKWGLTLIHDSVTPFLPTSPVLLQEVLDHEFRFYELFNLNTSALYFLIFVLEI